MKEDENGAIIAMSMTLTAIMKALPQDVANQAARELRASLLDAVSQDHAMGTTIAAAKSRNRLVGLYLDCLKQVADGSVLLVGGGKK